MSLLNALYNGELSPADLAPPKDPEYRAAVEKRHELIEQLQSVLSPGDIDRLDDLNSAHAFTGCFENEQAFSAGFCLGIRLIYEAFTGQISP